MSGYPHIDIVDLFNEVVSEHANAIILDKYLRERTGKDADFANADYVFHSEKVIAELKCLKNDNAASPNNQAKLTAAIDRFHAEGKVATKELNEQTWPTLPKELQNEVYNITTNAIRDRVAKANRQIRETKEKLGLTSYDGLLLIANDGIISLPPTAFIHSVARLLMNHFREIDCFIFFTANVFSAIIHSHASRLAKLVLVEARLESQRDSIIQPRVGPQRGTTLGHPPKQSPTPTGLHHPRPLQPRVPFNPFRVDEVFGSCSRGSSSLATPG